MSRRSNAQPRLQALGVPPEPGSVYELALTHRSFAFEQPDPIPHNERLEFLGDAVLGLVVTDLIYRRFPELSEGEMAKVRASAVNSRALAGLARSLGLGNHLRLGKGEESSGGKDKDSLLADTFEALIGAVYLDRGMNAAAAFLTDIFGVILEEIVAAGGGYDAKTELQETCVRTTGGLPLYRLVASGPEHAKQFTAQVFVEGELHGSGLGRSKKEAEQAAARQALQRLHGLSRAGGEAPGNSEGGGHGGGDGRAG